MRELERILEMRRSVDDLNLRIVELESMVLPKAQVITGMPRGGDHENAIEKYTETKITLEEKRERILRKMARLWKGLEGRFDQCGITERQKAMLEARFYNGLPWKRCVLAMRQVYPDEQWDEQKLFRMYRKVISRLKSRSVHNNQNRA